MGEHARENSGRRERQRRRLDVESVRRKLARITRPKPAQNRSNVVEHASAASLATVNNKSRSRPKIRCSRRACEMTHPSVRNPFSRYRRETSGRGCGRRRRIAATAVFFVQRLRKGLNGSTRAAKSQCAIRARAPRLRRIGVTDLGELMATDSYRAAVRPLVLTVAWFAFLAGAAFAWAAIEGQQSKTPPSAKPVVFVLNQ
jgi:hypothetical protein